jgi:hypothetical protein
VVYRSVSPHPLGTVSVCDQVVGQEQLPYFVRKRSTNIWWRSKSEQKINNPIAWWASNHQRFPRLTRLARNCQEFAGLWFWFLVGLLDDGPANSDNPKICSIQNSIKMNSGFQIEVLLLDPIQCTKDR